MTLVRSLIHANVAAPSTLDWLCSVETMREILQAMTQEQFVIAFLVTEGMTLHEIGDRLGMTYQGVAWHREQARERIARNVPEVMGDVLSRHGNIRSSTSKYNDDWHNYDSRFTGICADCGRAVYAVSKRCKPCAMREMWRERREAREAVV